MSRDSAQNQLGTDYIQALASLASLPCVSHSTYQSFEICLLAGTFTTELGTGSAKTNICTEAEAAEISFHLMSSPRNLLNSSLCV